MVSTRRTTLGAVSTNRARESLPGNFASSHRGIGGGKGKMKRKTTKSRMSMARRVGGGGNNDLGDENTSDFLLQPKKVLEHPCHPPHPLDAKVCMSHPMLFPLKLTITTTLHVLTHDP